MLEYGIYTIKQDYINKYSALESDFSNMGTTRPCICIKIGEQNWLLPMTSLDPKKTNFTVKKARVIGQLGQDKKGNKRAMTILPDFLHKPQNDDYKNVIYYSWAFPIKHNDVKKVKTRDCKHFKLPNEYKKNLKHNATAYIKEIWQGRYSGFMKVQADGGKNVAPFQRKAKELYREIFAKEIEVKKRIKLRQQANAELKKARLKKQKMKEDILSLSNTKEAVDFLLTKGYSLDVAQTNALLLVKIAERKLKAQGKFSTSQTEKSKTQEKTIVSQNEKSSH